MKNFPIEKDGQTYWVSRSVACGMIVFAQDKDNKIYVLANKRGKGCEWNVGKWNAPGGFIDYDENGEECAIRECYEETGVVIPRWSALFLSLNTEPKGARQTITIRYTAFLSTPIEEIQLTTEHSEPDEVEEIKWLCVDTEADRKALKEMDWSRDQYEYIMQGFRYWMNEGRADY